MLDDAKIAFLDDLLARTDALFLPPRVWVAPVTCLPNSAWTAVEERRHDFFRTGLSSPFSGDAAARKAGERLVEGLESDGLLKICKHGGRRVGLRLTQNGDDVVRHLTAQNLLLESFVWLLRMECLIAAEVSVGRYMVLENDLAAVSGCNEATTQALWNLERYMLPLQAAGLVDDTCDMAGHVYYCITKKGIAAAAKGCPEPRNLPEFRPGGGDRHEKLLRRYAAERLNWQGSPGHVVIPWSCGEGPKRSWRSVADTIPLVDIRAQ